MSSVGLSGHGAFARNSNFTNFLLNLEFYAEEVLAYRIPPKTTVRDLC